MNEMAEARNGQTEPKAQRRERRGLSVPFQAMLFLWVFVFSAKGYVEVSDTALSIATARSLVLEGNLKVERQDGYTLQGVDGNSYSKYGIGLALYYLPIVAACSCAAWMTGLSENEATLFAISFANIPFAMLSLWLFWKCLRTLGITRLAARLTVWSMGFGTLMWYYAVSDFSEVMQMTFLLLATYGLLLRRGNSVLMSGIGFAALILVKLVHIALLPLFLAYICVSGEGTWRKKALELSGFMVPVFGAIGALAALNWIRFGSPFETGYGGEASQFFPGRIFLTAPKLLWSLDKGMFIYSPILVLGLLGWVEFCRKRFFEAIFLFLLISENLLLTAAWHSWIGGWCYGPRLLVPMLPFWMIPVAFWLDASREKWRRGCFIGLTLVSILTQLPGIVVKNQEVLQIIENEMTPDERKYAVPNYVATLRVFWSKMCNREGTEVYRLSEFGVPTERVIDVSQYKSYLGFNLWTEHLSRRLKKSAFRWLPLIGILPILFALMLTNRWHPRETE